MKSKLLLSTILATGAMSAHADLLSLEVATGQWDHEASGQFQYIVNGSGDELDLDRDFGLEDEKEGYTYAIIRHAVPVIPNVKVMTTSLSHEGSNNNFNFDFGDQTYTGAVDTKLVLDHTDVTAFWNLLDTGVTFDLGLTARQLDGEATVDDGTTRTTTTVDGTIPMLYAGLAVSPIDNLRFSFEANYIGAGDSSYTDTIAKVSYHTSFMLGIEAGVRTMSLELDDLDDNFADMEFSGSFVGVSVKF
jgi:outer membrane protein